MLDAPCPRRTRSRSRPSSSPASTPTIPAASSSPIDDAREGLDGDEAEIDSLGERLDDVVTGAVRSAFRTTFIVTAGLALVAALVLLWGALAPAGAVGRPAIAAAAVAALLAAAGYGVAFADSERETVAIGDPREDRDLPDSGGITGEIQQISSLRSTGRRATSAPAARSSCSPSSTTASRRSSRRSMA